MVRQTRKLIIMKLKDLTDAQRLQAEENIINQGWNSINWEEELYTAFFWSTTPQGAKYWSDILSKFNNK